MKSVHQVKVGPSSKGIPCTTVWLCGGAPIATPNPSIERTRAGMALQALISFCALRALPARAAHVKLQGLPPLSSK